jgi:hypothetical protein
VKEIGYLLMCDHTYTSQTKISTRSEFGIAVDASPLTGNYRTRKIAGAEYFFRQRNVFLAQKCFPRGLNYRAADFL